MSIFVMGRLDTKGVGLSMTVFLLIIGWFYKLG